ncbi:MAG: MAP7 domain-containing protein [Candidatus Omnitrophota bacterium]|nr:MAP7 domain-containing protein [Candidatus Omnitrophota bacterium]
MGVIHKLKPEVLSFIIENKQNNPALSCRYLTSLVLEQLHIKVSKSSINAIFKENNLSMPIGRRRKLKKKKFNMPVLPVIEDINKKGDGSIFQALGSGKIEPSPFLQDQEKEKIAEEKTAQEAAENKRKQEEARKLEEEKAVQEAELKAEKEKWARLAEEEQKSKQPTNREEVILPKVELVAPEILPEDRVCSGAIILKALDYLIGGSKEINAAISRAIGGRPEDSLNLTEALIFKSLFGKDKFSTLGDLIGVQYSQEKLSSYYAQIKQITDIGLDTAKIISNVFTEAKGVKVHFIDGSIIHLDGQLHSSWPATRFPYDFSNTAVDLKNNLNKYFLQGQPLVLFSPSGYDILPKDFFNLLLNIGSKDNYPDSLTLFGNQLEELDNIPLKHEHRYTLVFGLWPWQFTSSRKVKKIGDFYLKYIKEIDRDLYLGEIEIDLFRASSNQSLSLKGCAVKTDLKEKIRLVILNSDQQAMGLDALAGIYLSRWPNFEEAFQDFSRKIELFTYAGTEQKFFSKDSFGMDTAGLTMELTEIFANYIKMLDAYLRWHFLPAEYAAKDFSSTSDCFYKIPVKLTASQSRVRARTLVSQDYQFLKDLEYLNCRMNERQISSTKGKIFWFESAFK